MMTTQNTESKQQTNIQARVLAEKFCYECGMRPLPWQAPYFAKLLSAGLSYDLISELIDRTARAPRPSYAYLSWMVAMCERSGIKDQLDWLIKPKITKDDLPL